MTSDKAAVIQRYEQSRIGMRKDDEGAWVSYTDHATALDDMTSDRDSWQEQASDRVKDWDEMRRKAEAAERRVADLVAAATQASATLSHIYHTVPLPREVEREAYADYQRLDEFLETFK